MQEQISSPNKAERPKRRSYTKEFKADLVAQCDSGIKSLAQIALDHRINANMLRKWQRDAHQKPVSTSLLPVKIAAPTGVTEATGVIEIAIGSAIVRFNGPVDRSMLVQC